jgi:hypothetical protein
LAKIGLNYSRARLELLDKRVKLFDKFFYDIINIKNVLTQLVDLAILWEILLRQLLKSVFKPVSVNIDENAEVQPLSSHWLLFCFW